MKYQVKSLEVNDSTIEISRPSLDNNENVFSMLVGKNAVGKTRALSKLVNSCVFRKNMGEVVETFDSLKYPSSVIAVSNSKFDRFPDPAVYGRRESAFQGVYHYFGLGSFRSGTSRILSKAFEKLLRKAAESSSHGHDLAILLDYVGFLPFMQIDFRRPYRYEKSRKGDESSHLYDEYSRGTSYSNPESIVFDFDFESCILPALQYFETRERSGKGLSLRLDLSDRFVNDEDVAEFCEFGAILLQAGLLKVFKLALFDKRTKNKLAFHQASSGQQCMLLMLFGIMGAIEDYSLICIDEPEISLHPRWQAEFIGILQTAFTSARGCHFVIATHSPQVIAGLTSKNGWVIDLENYELIHSSEYARKSADFQLTEVFHEPGFKNEYLIRVLLVLLSKVSNKQELTPVDRTKLLHLDSIKGRLETSDPVLHLLNQVRMLVE